MGVKLEESVVTLTFLFEELNVVLLGLELEAQSVVVCFILEDLLLEAVYLKV